ncbi:MAG: type II secretion system F family protein [Planctomycetaceae bacterium]
MLSNPDISWSALSAFARSMARTLEAGVDVRKALQTASRQSSDSRLPPAVENISRCIQNGQTLAEAIGEQGELFPRLFRDLVNVGEQTGNVPEVFAALAKYYDSRISQVREFRSAAAWPVIQLVAAICIIGLLIFILGILPPGPDGKPFNVTGLGLYGPTGALIWVGGWFGLAVGGFVAWKWVRNSFSGQAFLDPLLLSIPVLGHCMSSFATSRFSWCFALTQQAGMSIRPSLDCSLKATSNGAFIMAEPIIWQELAEGESLTDALAASKLFTTEYLQMVATAEQTGTVPEQLDRLSHIFEDDARRSMSRLTSFLSGAVWFFTASIVIFFIFRIAMIYIGMMNDAVRDIH